MIILSMSPFHVCTKKRGRSSAKPTPKTTVPAASVDVPFLVRITITDLNIRKGPGTDYDRTQFIPVGVYTIVEVRSGKGSTAGWGLLKSGAGWVNLDYCTRI